jgi:hypothetical protein
MTSARPTEVSKPGSSKPRRRACVLTGDEAGLPLGDRDRARSLRWRRGERPTAPPPPKASVAADLLRLYDYDAAAPLDVKEIKAEQKDGATVHDITYD